MHNAVIIAAAGSGRRAAGASERPKQFQPAGGEAVFTHALRAFHSHPGVGAILAVIRPGDEPFYDEASASFGAKLLPCAIGGETRQQSVLAGLRALKKDAPGGVLIHDAARPFVSQDIISRVLAALSRRQGSLAAIPAPDTLKFARDGVVERTIERQGLWLAQTPQAFHYGAILAAHEAAAAAGRDDFTDDAAIAEWHGLDVAVVEGSAANWKITTAADLVLADRLLRLETSAQPPDIRTGTGFDVHAFEPGDHVMLCGVKIPHRQKLKGHSDADAGLHALTDALLGAIGAGDIGEHFPPSDPAWAGAGSSLFLADAARKIERRGGSIVNVDVTIICEEPKIAPHRQAMRACIAAILGIAIERVSVKATTSEGLGFTGRREGIAAMASASVAIV